MLDQTDRITLLKLARDTLEEYLSTRRRLSFEPASPALLELRATFVTLRHRLTHDLRGCRGEIEPQYPLWESVQRVSILSATDDPRFRSMTRDELVDTHIEISVLTPMRLSSPDEVIVGQHGVMIRRGGSGGLFLPQVPVEQGWDREEYLSTLCWMKAGLPADAWRKPGTQLYTFEAEIFEEA